MNKQLAIISHPEFGEVRNVMVKGEPWFVAKDVCEILGHTNPSMAISLLDEDERGKKSLGRQGEAWVVNESGLYALIMRSNKPKAKPFRKWVTSEVLPSIRKFGFYVHPSAMLTKRQQNQLAKIMLETVKKYTTKDDVRKTARKMGVSARYVDRVLGGYSENRDVMMELQKRAIRNKAEWEDAYSPERMQRVLDALSGTVILVDDREPPVTGRSDRAKAREEYWETLRCRKGTKHPSSWTGTINLYDMKNINPEKDASKDISAFGIQQNIQAQDGGKDERRTTILSPSESPWMKFSSLVRNENIQGQTLWLEEAFLVESEWRQICSIRKISRTQFLQHAQCFLESQGLTLCKDVRNAYLHNRQRN